jgi:uncharacterized Fe-S cluster protein YjdI
MRDLVGEVHRKARRPWITPKVVNKMDERIIWKNVRNEVRKKN